MKVLEWKNLKFSFDKTCVLNGFSGSLEKGHRLALLGSSGCGKTTFLRLCTGLENPQEGEIYLRGEKVACKTSSVPPHLRSVGYVFQNFALFEKISVQKNIYYGCKSKEDRDEADKLIDLFKLKSHLHKRPHQLSGGERQKVALVRSLALKPDVIFMDEPFSSIDPEQTNFLIDEIKQHFQTLGVTAVIVTHSKDEADRFADRVIQMP